MSWASVMAARLGGLFRRKRSESELDDEVRFHLEMQIEDNLAAGMNPVEARYAALRRFGGVDSMKETYRERRASALVETTVQDIRYTARTLLRSPAFAITSVAVLALAIGASTAMLSVLNSVLFRPLPYRSPDQLAMLWSEIPSQGVREGRTAFLTSELWRSQSGSFMDMAVFDPVSVTLNTTAEAVHVSAVRVSPNFFELLGVQPSLGRTFSMEEAEQRQRFVLISHRFRQSHFGTSPGVIGSALELDGIPFRIIGVIPEGLDFGITDADVWVPHTLSPNWDALRAARGLGPWFVVGRLRPDVTLQQSQTEMSAIARRLDEQMPGTDQNRGISVVPLSLQITGPGSRLALWMMTGAVFFVLLIAAANVAGLSLARSTSRGREMAIRAALGASRIRIIRQILTESLTLAVMSGLLGLLVALAAIRFILASAPGHVARLNEVAIDPRVLGWTWALCLFTGGLVGLAPAITTARRSLNPSGRDGGRGIAGGVATRSVRRALVVTEFALAIILLVGAGLLVRSLRLVENVNLGFRPERVLSVQLSRPDFKATAQNADFFNRVLEQIESLPGVESAGVISDLFVGGSPEQVLTRERDVRIGSERLRFRSDEVSGGFFKAIGTPLLRGRFFSSEDGPDSPRVAIINTAMARRLWPDSDALGRRFKLGAADSASPWFAVIGVVGDMRRQGLENDPIPQMFESVTQNPPRLATILVRTSGDDPAGLVSAVKAAVRRVDTRVPLYMVTTLDNQLGGFLAQRRFQTSLLIAFSLVSLLMAAIGIYGLIQYSVATRRHEIGIRMALGARSGVVFRSILGEGLRLSLAGLALGLVGALWLGRAVSSFLFGISATDPVTYVTVSLLLTAVATAASFFPARRAIRIDPMSALRHD